MRPGVLNVGKLIVPALLFLVLTGIAQDVQIRTRVDLVVVPVTVKGRADELIAGLSQNDFTVMEDGRLQTITNFTADPVPLSAAVLVDTGLPTAAMDKVKQTFPALAGSFSEFDEVAVYRFDKFVGRVLDFSRDSAVVETSMKSLSDVKTNPSPYPTAPGGPFSIPGPVINGQAVVQPGQIGQRSTAIMPKVTKVLNDAIFIAASDLAKRERDRRKIVLVVSDGHNEGNDHSFDETVKSLLEAGIQVYAVGLDQFFGKKLSVLSDYARATGGDSFFVNSLQNIEKSYASATEEARNQYVLGYVSTNQAAGVVPIFRNIQIQMAKSGVEVLHRKGYYQYP